MQIIDPNTHTLESVSIDPATTQDQWLAIHRSIVLCKRASARWIRQSRAFAAERWGMDFVADSEVQMELVLGIEAKDPAPAALNPQDKSKALVTIEGISQSFSLWERKMRDEVLTWDRPRLTRALELLEPMERQAREVRAMLHAL